MEKTDFLVIPSRVRSFKIEHRTIIHQDSEAMSPSSATAKEAPDAKAKPDESSVKAAGENVASKPKAKVGNANDPESRSKKKTNLAPSESRSGSATSGTPGAYRITGMGSSSQDETQETSDQSQTIDDTIEQSEEITAPTITTHELTDADAEGTNGSVSSPQVTTAYLVREKVVAEVEPIKPFYQRKEGKTTILLVTLLIVGMAVLLGVLLNQDAQQAEELMPTMAPTQSPTFDPRPTLEVVQDRGVLNCGLEDFVTEGAENFGQYNEDFCRGLAAVVFGDPEKFEPVYVGDDRYDKLLGREVDVLYAGDTFTLAKMIKEVRTKLYSLFRVWQSFDHMIVANEKCLVLFYRRPLVPVLPLGSRIMELPSFTQEMRRMSSAPPPKSDSTSVKTFRFVPSIRPNCNRYYPNTSPHPSLRSDHSLLWNNIS